MILTTMNQSNSPFLYRELGNCFSNAFIKGCLLLGDSNLNKKSKPELVVFTETELKKIGKSEYKPALKYLQSNKYQYKIMDPNPGEDWGPGLPIRYISRKMYKKADVYKLVKEGWCVIPAVIGKDRLKTTHAILLFDNKIWDPINRELWISPQHISVFNRYFPSNEKKRHLFAFKK